MTESKRETPQAGSTLSMEPDTVLNPRTWMVILT